MYLCGNNKQIDMKKVIEIKGELKEKGSTANKLGVKAAEQGVSLSKYIKDLLCNHVKN